MIHQPANVTRQVTRSTRSARMAVSNASRRPRLRQTSMAEHRQTTGRARRWRGHRGGCAPRGLQSTSPDLWRAEGTSMSTPAAAAWRAHLPIGGECARQAASHGYTAPVPSARRSRTDRDPVRNKRFVIHDLALNRLQQAIKHNIQSARILSATSIPYEK